MSSVGYGFLWNLPSYGNLSITPENITWFSAASQNIDFWVTTTPPAATSTVSPYATLLRQFVDVVGHAPPMPFYSTGFIQSKNRYRTQAQLLEVCDTSLLLEYACPSPSYSSSSCLELPNT